MTIITCATCGKVEDRAGWARYCLACGRERIRTRARSKSKVGELRSEIALLQTKLNQAVYDVGRLRDRLSEARQERDAALARVKELERELAEYKEAEQRHKDSLDGHEDYEEDMK